MTKYLDYLIVFLSKIKNSLVLLRVRQRLNKSKNTKNPIKQQLEIYNEEGFAKELSFWGEQNVWRELELLLCLKSGKVLDMCCGVGGTMHRLNRFQDMEVHGFDISKFLIGKAVESGINSERVKVANAIKTDYPEDFFDYSYSIGSLEHFTEKDILLFLKETKKITKYTTMHQIPVARNESFNGWLELDQSYFNMPEEWWTIKFKKYFKEVHIIDSSWEDSISFGKWFICK